MGLLDDVLGSLTGQGSASPAGAGRTGGASLLIPALMALLAARSGGSGLGNLGGILGNSTAAPSSGQTGGLGGLLGGLLGSGNTGGNLGGLLAGGGLAGALGQLLQSFQQAGHGDVANSWVQSGPNRSVTPTQVTQALGPDAIDQLAQHTGMAHADVAAQLSQLLPQIVDRLTPQGRLPTAGEASQWV